MAANQKNPALPTARETQAWDLIQNGHTYEGAAKLMNVSFQRVHQLVKSFLDRPTIKARGFRAGNLELRIAGDFR